VLHHHRIAGAQSFFGQLWKEYALSDSRYMTSDPLVLCMETCTVVSSYLFSWQASLSEKLKFHSPHIASRIGSENG
jgi:hypothetical protein